MKHTIEVIAPFDSAAIIAEACRIVPPLVPAIHICGGKRIAGAKCADGVLLIRQVVLDEFQLGDQHSLAGLTLCPNWGYGHRAP